MISSKALSNSGIARKYPNRQLYMLTMNDNVNGEDAKTKLGCQNKGIHILKHLMRK